MFSRKTTFAIAVAAAASLSSVVAAHADELNVIVTGVYEHVLDDLIEPFRIETGHVVRMSATNAGGVIRKVEANEPADVVMTSAAGIDELLAKGRIAPDSKVEIGRMRLGVAVRPGSTIPDLATTNAVRAALLSAPKVAYIDPNGGATAGPLFARLFARLGIASEMKTNGVLGATGNDVVQALVAGKATLGLSQASEIIGVNGAQFVGYLPDDLQFVSVYSAGIAANARSPAAAKAFLRFVTGARGAERFRRSGWDVESTSR